MDQLNVLSARGSLLIDNMPKAQHVDCFLFFSWVLGAEHCLEVYRQ